MVNIMAHYTKFSWNFNELINFIQFYPFQKCVCVYVTRTKSVYGGHHFGFISRNHNQMI